MYFFALGLYSVWKVIGLFWLRGNMLVNKVIGLFWLMI